MKLRNFVVPMLVFAALAYSQTCPQPAPATPPKATGAFIRHTNPDGGARPCDIMGQVNGGAPAKWYPVAQGNRCDVAKEMADQAVAKDNGWDDGGAP